MGSDASVPARHVCGDDDGKLASMMKKSVSSDDPMHGSQQPRRSLLRGETSTASPAESPGKA